MLGASSDPCNFRFIRQLEHLARPLFCPISLFQCIRNATNSLEKCPGPGIYQLSSFRSRSMLSTNSLDQQQILLLTAPSHSASQLPFGPPGPISLCPHPIIRMSVNHNEEGRGTIHMSIPPGLFHHSTRVDIRPLL